MKTNLYSFCILILAITGLNQASAQTYLSEDFEVAFTGSPAAPAGWSQSRYANAGETNTVVPAATTNGPKDWQQNVWTGAAWSFGTGFGVGPSGAQSGTGCLYMNDSYFMANTAGTLGGGWQERRIESSAMNLVGSTSPYLTFHLFHPTAVNSGNTVRIMASNDNGVTWNIIGYALPNASENLTGGAMSAATPWQKIRIKIPNAYKTANAKIAFTWLNLWGVANVFIDNLSVAEYTPTTITSAGTGLWNVGATWVGGIVPNADNNVVIAAGHTVTQNQNATRIQNLTIDGTLNYTTANAATEIMYVHGDMDISATGNYVNGNTTLTTGKQIYIGGNFTNNGIANFQLTGSTLFMAGGDPVSISGIGTYVSSHTAGTLVGRINAFVGASTGGVTFNAPITVLGNFNLMNGTVNPNGNLLLGTLATGGTPLIPTAQITQVGKGSISVPGATFTTLTGARSTSYVNFAQMPAVAQNITPGLEIPLVSGARTVQGTLSVSTFSNITLAYPLNVGTPTIGGLTLTRGILVTDATNILSVSPIVTPPIGLAPSLVVPTTTAGSYIAGPMRVNMPTSTLTRNFPLGQGTNYNNASGSAMTPVANALRYMNLSPGGTVWTAGTNITGSIVGPPTGVGNAPLTVPMGVRAFNLDANGGPDLPATATLLMGFMNTVSPIPNVGDNLVGNLQDIRVSQSTSLSGPWTERSNTLGTGAIPNNVLTTRTTVAAAPGPISTLAANGGFFAWATVGIAKDMSATALAAPSAVGCFGASQTVSITIRNNGVATIDFSIDPVTVTATGTDPSFNVTNFPAVVLNLGTLAPGASQNVVVSNSYNMSAVGVYTFTASTSVAGDGVPLNDAMPTATATWANPLLGMTASASPAAVCSGASTTLSVSPGFSATNYAVQSVPYSPPINMVGATAGPVGDDAVMAAVPIGFSFNYYGTTYTALNLSTNGNLQFSSAITSFTPQAIPTAAGTMDNYIGFPWLDFYQPGGGNINYRTIGTAPTRTFVVSFNALATYPTLTVVSDTIQVRLYETSNVIDVYIKSCGSTNNKVLGVEGPGGTLGVVAPGRQLGAWTVGAGSPEGWRFFPPIPGLTYSWTPSGSLNNATIATPTATPPSTTTYTGTVSASGCSVAPTVTVTVTNTPSAPITTGATICGPGNATLSATGSGGTLSWTASPLGGPILAAGGTYSPYVGVTTTFYVFESPAQLTQNVGLLATAPGTTVFASATNNYQTFDVLSTNGILINTVDIVPNALTPLGTAISIQLQDNTGANVGSPVNAVTTTQGTVQTLTLDMFVPTGTGWRLTPVQNPNLQYHQTGFVNPYTLPGQVSITGWGPPNATTLYVFFYNWSVRTTCFSPLASAVATVTTPPTLSITPPSGGYCGPSGSVTLTASGAGYTNYSWTPGTGLSATVGATVTASPLVTTTYLCTATGGGCADTQTVVISANPLPAVSITSSAAATVCPSSTQTLTATASSASIKQIGYTQSPAQVTASIYNGGNTSIRSQLLFTAAELNAAGIFGPSNLTSIGWYVSNKLSTGNYQNYTISIAPTALAAFPSTAYIAAGLVTVFTGTVTTSLGWNMHAFTTPFAWDGTSNIVVNTCFTNPAAIGFDQVYTSTAGANRFIAGNLLGCAAGTGTLSLLRPNTRFMGGTVNYNWTPALGLSSTNTAVTVATASGTPGNYSYTCTVTDPATNCTNSATYNFTVSGTPAVPTITVAAPGATNFCPAGGTVTLNMTGSTTANMQWQSSPGGANTWTNIAGANGSSYTSPTILANTDYRLELSCGGSAVSNVIAVIIANPVAPTTTGASRCGPGTLTLTATSPSFVNWYDAPTGGTLLGSGYTYTTPSIATTTTYYAEAWATGGSAPTLPLPNNYCVPTVGITGATGDFVNNFTFNTISNLASGDFAGDFQLYPQTTTVQAGLTYTLTAQSGATFGQGFGVWIDYNQNGLFSDPGEFVFSSVSGTTLVTGSVLIPVNVASGQTRLRITARYNSTPLLTESCGHATFGEYEDYIITMLGGGAVTCTSPTRTATVATVNPLPAATIGSNAPVCAGTTLNLTASGGVTYSWTGPNSFTSASQNPTIPNVAGLNGGTYTVTVTDATPCSLAVSTVVAISPLPVISATAATPNPLCEGATLNLTSSATPGFIGYSVAGIPYAPQTGGTPISPTSGDDAVSASIPLGFNFDFYGTVYTNLFVYTNGYVQLGAINGNTFTYGQVLPSAATPNNIIAGVFEDLNAGVGAITYFTTGTSPNQVFNIRYNNVPYWAASGNTNFQIQLFESTNVIEVHVFENANGGVAQTPTLGIENSTGTAAVVPAGHNGTFFAVSAVGAHEAWRFTPASVTYSWTGPNSFSSVLANDAISNITLAGTGAYILTAQNSLGCTATATQNVVVNANPVPTITAGGPTTFCTGGSVVLDAGGPYNSYSWSNSANTQTITASASGSYTVTVTNAALCTGTSAPTTVTLNPAPTGVTASTSTSSICLPGTVDLTGTGTASGPPIFSWTSTPAGYTSSTQNPTGITPSVGATTYTLTVTDPNNLCTTTASTPAVNVGTNTNATITFAGSSTICAGTPLTLVASTPSAATLAYQWYLGGTAIGGATSVTYDPTVSGNYTVDITETVSPNCSSTSAATTVTINPLPSLVATPTNVLCFGAGTGSATVVATGTPSFSYSWNTSPAQVSATATNLAAGTYIVNVMDGNNCSDTAWVTITSPASAVLADAGVDATLCSGSSTTLTATGSGGTGGITYSWDNGATQGGSVTPASTTTYTVTATDANNCTDTDDIVLTINPGATVTAGPDISNCGLAAIDLAGAIGGSATLGTWSGIYAGTFSSLTNPTGTYTPAVSEVGSTLTFTLTTNDPDGAGPCPAVSDAVAITIGGYSTTLAPPVASATPWVADYENTDAFGWTHYYDNASTPANYCDDFLILSVQNANSGGNAIGHVGDPGFMVKVAGQGAYTLTNATTPYVNLGVTWYLMGRYWEATPVTQPVNDVNVRFYFTNADFNAVNAVSPYVSSSPTQMAFYKINNGVGGTPSYNPDPVLLHAGVPVASPFSYDGTGYWQYFNGVASTSTWGYSPIGLDHTAEYTIDRFSGGGGGGGTNNPGAFPVELLSFTGYNNGDENILQWTTNKEINNKEFVLMRSLDNVTFQEIETLPTLAPNGMSNTPIDYSTKDLDFGNKTYYRLKQIDINGESHLYSNVVELNINNDLNTVVSLFPNPAKELLNLSITQPKGGKHRVELYDAIGKLVSSHKEDLNAGNTIIPIDVAELAKGTYIIMVKNADNGVVATTRFVKE